MRHSRAGRPGARGRAMSAGWRSRAGAVLLVAPPSARPRGDRCTVGEASHAGIPRTSDGSAESVGARTEDPRRQTRLLRHVDHGAGQRAAVRTRSGGVRNRAADVARGRLHGREHSGGLPYQPWAAELVKKNMATSSKDDPHGLCLPDTFLRAYGLPHIVKFVQTPQLLIALEELQRRLPADLPRRSRAAGRSDSLVEGVLCRPLGGRHARRRLHRFSRRPVARLPRQSVDECRQGPRADHPAGLRSSEHRGDGGRPEGYTRPWTVRLQQQIIADTEIIDEICLENEKFMRACADAVGSRGRSAGRSYWIPDMAVAEE